jgi:hypothetical protein
MRKKDLSSNVKTTDGRAGWTGPMPDDRVLVTLTDDRAFAVDAGRLKPQGDGTYLIALTADDRSPMPPSS